MRRASGRAAGFNATTHGDYGSAFDFSSPSDQALAPAFAHTVRQRTVRLQHTALQALRCVTERNFCFHTFFT
ncbi:hypothetical protein [Xanthomonas arboricola]|uniref:hypothetical protein n=1 Tax=Xanthomonas arboricola TaxID=56448 RepID=UPI0016075679|nr:hypothetical protein [Xanthomonas arboricola]MBB5861000.1 hypothetical protein [Xanthomonas arboricola]